MDVLTSELTQAPLTKELVFVPETSVKELQFCADWTSERIKSLLPDTPYGKGNLDHVGEMSDNVNLLYEKELKRPLTEKEKLVLEIAENMHDVGKWDKEYANKLYRSEEGESVVAELGLSNEEKSILKKGFDSLKGTGGSEYTPQSDIAHHLISAFLVEAYSRDPDKLGKLDLNTKKQIVEAIIAHQFKDYYERLAQKLKYPEEEVKAIVRPIENNSPMGRALRDGDILSMTQVGEVIDDGFRLGGNPKIVNLGVASFLRGDREGPKTIEECFDSADNSVAAVGRELVTDEGRKMYEGFKGQTVELRGSILLDPAYRSFLQQFKPGLSIDEQERLKNKFDRVLRLESERIAKGELKEKAIGMTPGA